MSNLVALGTVAKVRNGYAFASSDFQGEGIPVIRMSDLGDFAVDTEGAAKVPCHFLDELPSYRIEKGDIIIGMSGSVGKVAVYRSEKPALQNQRIGVFKVLDASKLDQDYLRFFSLTLEARLLELGKGVAVKNVSSKEIEALPIPLPPLPEQKHIATILVKADRFRHLRRYARDLSDTYLQSVFLEMFGDPVSNPMGWSIVKLSSIGRLDRGKSKNRPRNAPELYGGPYPFVQTGDVANASGYIRAYKQTYSELGLKQSKLWPSGTLCITIAANIAKTAIMTFDACFPDSVVGFVPNEKTNIEFVQQWFAFIQGILEETAPESAQKNINLRILRNLDIPLPPLPLQGEFARIVRKFERLCAQQREAERQAEHLFQTLLHQAFRGEV